MYNDIRKSFLSANISRAKGREKQRQITIDVDYLFKLGEKQQWKCNLTGLPLEFTRGGATYGNRWLNPHSCSIDRIDTTLDYIPGNVQLVCAIANDMKSVYSVSDLVKYSKLIVETAASKQLTLPNIQPVYTARAAARTLGKSRTLVHNAIKKGTLKAKRKSQSKEFEIEYLDLHSFATEFDLI
jgi:hypothetical protein